jgi:hypothetical protein
MSSSTIFVCPLLVQSVRKIPVPSLFVMDGVVSRPFQPDSDAHGRMYHTDIDRILTAWL